MSGTTNAVVNFGGGNKQNTGTKTQGHRAATSLGGDHTHKPAIHGSEGAAVAWVPHLGKAVISQCKARIALDSCFGVDFRERLLWGKQRAVDCQICGGDVLIADVLVSNCFRCASSLKWYGSGQMYRLCGSPFCGS
jgi:hypothetical protein